MKKQWLLIILLYLCSMSVKASQGISVSDAYLRLLPTSVANTAAYMLVTNNTSQPLSIIAAKSSKVNKIEIHGHQMKDGVMAMVKHDSVTIAANSSVVFQPGGRHFMLLNIDNQYHEMKSIDFELLLSDGTSLKFDVAVGRDAHGDSDSSKRHVEKSDHHHKHHHH